MQMEQTSAWCVAAGGRRWAGVWACAVVCVSLCACADEAAAAKHPAPGSADVELADKMPKSQRVATAFANIVVTVDALLASMGGFKSGDLIALARVNIRTVSTLYSRLPALLRKNKELRHFFHLPVLEDNAFSAVLKIYQTFLDALKVKTTVKPSAAPGVTGSPSQPTSNPQRQATLEAIDAGVDLLKLFTKNPENALHIKLLAALRSGIEKAPHFVLDGRRLNNLHDEMAMLLQGYAEIESTVRHILPDKKIKHSAVPTAKHTATGGPQVKPVVSPTPAPGDSTQESTASASTSTPRDAHGARKGRSHTVVIALCVAGAVVACCAVAVGVVRWRKAAAGTLRTAWGSDADAPNVELVAFGEEHEGGAGTANSKGRATFN